MASKSIIDRVLLLAAAVCAAGLIWQLTVLLTSKGRMPAARGVDMASSAAAAPGNPALPVKPQAKADTIEPAQPPVRVVYPDADTPKTTAKITESVPSAPTTQPGAPSVPTAPAVSAATAPAPTTPDPSPNAQPTTGLIPVAMVAPISRPQVAPAPPAPVAASPGPAMPSSAPAPDEVASVEPAAPAEAPADQTPVAAPNPAASRTININSASVAALDRLRGGGHIGQAIARHRPYRSVDDLMRKRVLRRDVFERIRGQIAAK